MVSIIKTEFSKMKRYSVIWIGVATMFTVVLLARFMATASDGATQDVYKRQTKDNSVRRILSLYKDTAPPPLQFT